MGPQVEPEWEPMPGKSRALFQFAAGGSAGLLELLLLHPLDVVKTRLQLQGVQAAAGELRYTGVFDCISKIYSHEGVAAFWKGIVPPICSETPKRAAKFVVYEQAKPLFLFGALQPTALTHAMAGALAGTLECFFLNPFEVVKITQQADRSDSLNTLTVARRIVQTDGYGIKGLYRGITALMIRNAIFHFAYFGIYQGLKDEIPAYQHDLAEFFRRGAIGFFSSSISCLFSTTFDVAKSRIQGPQPTKGSIKYKWTVPTIKTIYEEEGFRALYKGLSVKIMRAGPGGAILMLAYEYGYEYLTYKYG
ncbi:mitochondrial 2-oxodicarboxylate carrier [Drosophila pseudoobscura]|uniref:Mitochondrial 2-oxodicarboxylate carrier n=1 Tax=Drosophila pseudoobscura pseudoobscura TaxID=46245 RepID=A0A6I8UI96_DROPS|nr:mitochondrial 2-oxodicarboxylate carrier [Drosophila pseudoobscura]